MRFVVLGARGQLGRDLCPRLPGEVIELGRNEIDLCHAEQALAVLRPLQADVLINCAAYNFVDRAETESQSAFATNALGVFHLARACNEIDCRFVHFSTDYVFGADASRATPYEPDDLPGPVSVYGASKLAGEHLVRIACKQALVIRTCGLYGVWGSGGKGGNFIETMLRLAQKQDPLKVVNDQHCTPSYTADVADTAIRLIQAGATGLVHATNSGNCSWYELARFVFDRQGLKVNLTAIPSSGYPAPAKRPGYSVLGMNSLIKNGVPVPRPWQEAVQAYLVERSKK